MDVSFETHQVEPVGVGRWSCKAPADSSWSFEVTRVPQGIVLSGDIHWQIIEFSDPTMERLKQCFGTDRDYLYGRMRLDKEEEAQYRFNEKRYKQWILGLKFPSRKTVESNGKVTNYGDRWGYGRYMDPIPDETARELWDKARYLGRDTNMNDVVQKLDSIEGIPDEWFRDIPFFTHHRNPRLERQIDAFQWFLKQV